MAKRRTPEEFAAEWAAMKDPVVIEEDATPEAPPFVETPEDTVSHLGELASAPPPDPIAVAVAQAAANPTAATVTLTLEQVVALLANAQQARAAAPADGLDAVVKALQAIANQADARAETERRTRQVPIHLIKRRTAQNPTGEKLPPLRKMFLDSGFRVLEDQLGKEEILLLNQLRPGEGEIVRGEYKFRWRVTETTDAVNLWTDNKTPEQRASKLVIGGGTLVGVLSAILADQAKKGTRSAEQYVA